MELTWRLIHRKSNLAASCGALRKRLSLSTMGVILQPMSTNMSYDTNTTFVLQEFHNKKWRNTCGEEYKTLKQAEKQLDQWKLTLDTCALAYGKTFSVKYRILEVHSRVFMDSSYTAHKPSKRK